MGTHRSAPPSTVACVAPPHVTMYTPHVGAQTGAHGGGLCIHGPVGSRGDTCVDVDCDLKRQEGPRHQCTWADSTT